jgi:MFS family permease
LSWDPRRLFYGWWIVIAGSTSFFIVSGVAVYGFGTFIKPMRQDLGWTVAAISAASSIRSFEQGLMAPVTGYLVDKLGPRSMAVAGALFLTLGCIVFGLSSSLPVFFLSAMIIALGTSMGPFTPFTAATMNWFNKGRGRAMGILNTGNGLGYLAVPIMVWLIDAFGWRNALYILAAVVAATCLPLALVVRARPEQYGFLPDGGRIDPAAYEAAGGRKAAAVLGPGMEVKEVVRIPAFYLLTAGSGLLFGAHIAWLVHQVPHLQDVGFSAATAGFVVGAYGVSQFFVRAIVGWLGDALGRRRVYIASFFLQAMGYALFAVVTPQRAWLLPVFIALYGLGNAGTVIMSQTIVADYFGTRRFATMRGLSNTLTTPLGILTPIIAGRIFDQTDTYTVIFLVYSVVMVLGGACILLVRRPQWSQFHPPGPAPAAKA